MAAEAEAAREARAKVILPYNLNSTTGGLYGNSVFWKGLSKIITDYDRKKT